MYNWWLHIWLSKCDFPLFYKNKNNNESYDYIVPSKLHVPLEAFMLSRFEGSIGSCTALVYQII